MTNPDRSELVKLNEAGLEAAVRECARITAPEITNDEYERIKADNSPRYQNTRAEMERTLRAYLNAARSQPNVQPALEAPAAGDGEPVAWPSDGSCVRCGAVPRTASGLCNTCLDEDAERYENAPPADAGMREAFVRVLASLAAAISILERTPKAKKAVASDKMFNTMLEDYRKALEAGRTALTAPGATTKSDGGAKAGSSPILASKEEQRPDTHGMMPVGDNAANVGCTGVGPSDPSSTRSDVTVEAKHLVSSARAFLAHFDPCDLAEDKSQQWQSLEHQCNRVERALLDQFEIRRRK